jgi:hypothetical protein
MEEEINISLVSHIEMRLRRSLLDPAIKAKYQERLINSQDRNELLTILRLVEENQPIMGLEIIPQGQGEELTEAIKNRVARDDFYDRYKD